MTHDTQKMTIVKLSGSRDKLTQDMQCIRNIRSSDPKVNKTSNNMLIASEISKKLIVNGLEMNIEFHGSLNSAMISDRSVIKEILNILLLGEIETFRCRRDLNPKEVTKKLATGTCLDKGNIRRIISSNDHITNIEQKKGPTTR